MRCHSVVEVGWCVLAVGLGALAGCQHFDDSVNRSVLSPGEGKAGCPVASARAADKQVALGRSLEKQGDLEHAQAAYLDAVNLNPRQADASWRLAVLCDRQGKWKESAEHYRHALAASPGNPDLYCDVGYSFYLQHSWREAEMNYRQALALAPENRRAHTNLGLLLARTKRETEALAEFRRANCDLADAHNNVAFALSQDRHWEEARGHYERALAADSSSDTARKGLHDLNVITAQARDSKAAGAHLDQNIQLTSEKEPPEEPARIEIPFPERNSEP